MKAFIKYFLMFGLATASCSAMTDEEQPSQDQYKKIIELMNQQQEMMKRQQGSVGSTIFKGLAVLTGAAGAAALGYVAAKNLHASFETNKGLQEDVNKALQLNKGLQEEVAKAIQQNTTLQQQIINLQEQMDVQGATSWTRWCAKALLTLFFTEPLAWLPILL